ncbi:hypothetical protein N8K70_16460 [Microbacterium betulae]|uniref:Uncharacterized protein n=1 Tax=Microbacterium betulae TaxID=2981139 RepID=A0AA97I725_9MICO|nr:hypothetical protein [Microbacterium sp. AB]WOF22965.1 hypothetical protein N8K70_16460 [Microbacterium sp. AB]
MMTEEELRRLVGVARGRIDGVATEVREAASSLASVSMLTMWRSEAADRFRASSRDLVAALHGLGFRCDAEAEALASAARTTLFPAA